MDASPRRSDLRLVLLLAAILGALALTGFALSLPKVEPAPRPGEFDTNDALALLSRVLGDERPHSVDTLANDAVRERLLAEIRAMGYAPEVRDDFSCRAMAKYSMTACARVRNIVFRAGPQDGEAVMLAAHYDSVPAGPGGADDGLGVSVELEIAKIFSKAPPTKPLLFLVTDGEEMGLLGAHSFVRNDPLAGDIAAVVNIEARGDKGPAVMFQTSAPNSADIAAFAKGAGRPFSNSMMTDIYRLLPNDTDVTEFLPKGYDALNIALGDGLSHYHTPHDTIANLDPRSVQHTGRQALGALRSFLNAPAKAGEHQVVFTDILSRFLLTVPQWLAGAMLLVGLGAAAFSYVRGGGARPLRASLAPPAMLVASGVFCWLAQKLVALRPEALYWYAHPLAMEAVAWVSAALAVIVALKFIVDGAGRQRVIASAWFWFAAVGAAFWFIAPGASILFAPALLVYAIGVAVGMVAPAAKRWIEMLAALLVLIVLAPSLYLSEIMLGGGAAPAFAIVAALIMVPAAPLVLGEEVRLNFAPVIAASAALVLTVGAAFFVPAYTKADPEPMNIQYVVDADQQKAEWVLSGPAGEPAPRALSKIADFKPTDIAGLGRRRAAAADYVAAPSPSVAVLSSAATTDGGRRILIELHMAGADMISVLMPKEAGAVSLISGGETDNFGGHGSQTLNCAGRACDDARLEIVLKNAEPQDWRVLGIHFGLPESAAALLAARPDDASPIQTGDATIVETKIKI